jgi:hypothetical protein
VNVPVTRKEINRFAPLPCAAMSSECPHNLIISLRFKKNSKCRAEVQVILIMHWHPAPKIPKRGGTRRGAQDRDSGSDTPGSCQLEISDLDPGSNWVNLKDETMVRGLAAIGERKR